MRPAGPVGDPAVERLDRQAAGGIARDQGVKATTQPVDLDDVTGFDALQTHGRLKARRSRRPEARCFATARLVVLAPPDRKAVSDRGRARLVADG